MSAGPPVGTAIDRRRSEDARLDSIAEEISALRTELRTFMTSQATVNTEFRDHITASRGLGVVHEDQWDDLTKEVAQHGERIRSVEDWRTRLDTYGTILRLTFGASVIGAILSLAAVVNMLITFGK